MVLRGEFMRQFTVGAAAVIASVLMTGLIAVVGVRAATATTDRLGGVFAQNALAAMQLETQLDRRSSFAGEYLLTGDERALAMARAEGVSFESNLSGLRARARSEAGVALLDRVVAAEARYGLTLDDALGTRVRGGDVALAFVRVVPAKDALANLLSAYEALKEQQFIDAEAASVASNKRTVVLVTTVAGLALLAAVALTLLIWRGIRELTRGKALVETSLARVEQSNRDLDAFAGRVAHDLRGVLGPVLMAPKLLRADNVSADRAQRLARTLDLAVERAVGLMDALLAFSRAGATPDVSASASARRAIAEVVDWLAPSVAQADARVLTDVDDAEVCCPAGLLHIVVANLVGNSLKFIQGRSVREVQIKGRLSRGGYELRIEDTGPGIPPDAQARIFEPFYRVPGTRVSGTGIGLATVRRVVDVYGGRIAVESIVGEGSTFQVWLPLARATGARALVPESADTTAERSRWGSS